MKKRLLPVVTVLSVLAALATARFAFASSGSPGTASDPIVTKSYVDNKLNELSAQIAAGGTVSNVSNGSQATQTITETDKDAILAGVMEQLEIYYADSLGAGAYVPVSLAAGQVLLGAEGTEIILRSGSAKGYVDGLNGIVDATDGTEVFNNSNIVVNHLLIIPRDDGRGVEALTDAWLIVKGGYTLKEPLF